MCCSCPKVIKRDSKCFLAIGTLHEDKILDTLQALAPTNVKTIPQISFCTPYQEQPRSTRIVVAFPRPTFSATKRKNPAPIRFNQQAQVYQDHASCMNMKHCNTKLHGGEGLELNWLSPHASQHPAVQSPLCILGKSPRSLARSLLLVGPRRKKTYRS